MWFTQKKDLDLNILGNSNKLTWEELGEFFIGLAEVGMQEDFTFISSRFNDLKNSIENRCEYFLIVSISLRVAIYYISFFGIDARLPIEVIEQKSQGINKGLLNVQFRGRNNIINREYKKSYSEVFIATINLLTDYLQNRNDSDTLSVNTIGMVISNSLHNSYGLENENNTINKYHLASYYEEVILNTLEICAKQSSMKLLRSMSRNPFE